MNSIEETMVVEYFLENISDNLNELSSLSEDQLEEIWDAIYNR